MDNMSQQWNFSEGTDVVGSDGEKVGEIVAVQSNYIVVEKGFFFPTDYYIPTSAIGNYDGDKVYLNVSKDDALNQGWDSMPADDVGYATTTTTDTYTTGSTTGGYAADMGGTDVSAYDVDNTRTSSTYTSEQTTANLEGDVLRVPVHEEELTAVTREREVGEVQISKDVISEERVLEVPVTEERVRVERHIVDRDATVDDVNAFQEGTIEVPLRAEEVELHKRTRVSEEIEIGKEAVQRTEQVAGTVRREVVDVTEHAVDTARTDVSRARTSVENTGESIGDSLRDAGRSVKDTITGDDKNRR